MMKSNRLFFLLMALFIAGIYSCTKETTDQPPVEPAGYSQGVFILNEGPFQTGTGTITYLNRDGSGLVQKIYQEANEGLPLGNIVQSMNLEPVAKLHAYVAVNNANRIEVVDIKTFKRIQTIENITSPRHIYFGSNDKAYISAWDNTVKVISTVGYEFFGQITVGTGPEKMQGVGTSLWVLNQGGFSVDSTISIIDTGTDELIHTLAVYPKPTGIQVDADGFVWVLCSGKGWNGFPAPDDSKAHLLCIHPVNYAIIKDIPFPNNIEHPEKLVINREGDMLYYNQVDGIYRFDIHGNELETAPFVPHAGMYYGLGLDSQTNTLYASDPLDYVQNGRVYRYDAYSGTLLDSLSAGIIPTDFYFSDL